MVELTFTKKKTLQGKQSVPWEKGHNQRLWGSSNTKPLSFDDDIGFLEEGAGDQWSMVEDYCWLYLGKKDAYDRYVGKGMNMATFHGVGMSNPSALTDEDEFVLEFGTKKEKRALLADITLTSSYRIEENGNIQKRNEEGNWENILDEEEPSIEGV